MNLRLHVERWGTDGPPILLLHGIGGSGRYWRSMADALRGEFHLVVPDLLGFGRSPWPEIEYTVDDHLDALDATVAAEDLATEALIVVGHSLGAILALAWAARLPTRCVGLVLIGLPRYRSRREAQRHVARLSPLAYATVARPRIGAVICALMCFGRPFWRRIAPVLMPDLPSDVARDGVLHTWTSYSRTLRHAILDTDVGALARHVAAAGLPVRLLHGTLDRDAPLQGVEGLARELGWELRVLAGASHALPIERPRDCAAAIGEFGRVLVKPRSERVLVTDERDGDGHAARSGRGTNGVR